MCGITALSRANDSSIRDAAHFMQLAALAIEPRGQDATGWAWVRANGDGFYWKSPQRARLAVRDVKLDHDIQTAIAHTRAATQGDKSNNVNNHPVIDDGIMLVHNGILWNDHSLYRTYFDKDYVPPAEVDSQVIATLLAHRNAIGLETVTNTLEQLRGSAAVAWIETNDTETLHLARCAERPLTLAWTRKGDLVMSSTPETLRDAARYARIKLRRMREVEEGTYLTVRAGEIIDEQTFSVEAKRYTQTGWSSSSSTPALGTVRDTGYWGWARMDGADRTRLEREIEEFWERHSDPVDDVYDDEVVGADGVVVEVDVVSDGELADLAADRARAEHESAIYWEGFQLHRNYRRDLAKLLGLTPDIDAVVSDEWDEIYESLRDGSFEPASAVADAITASLVAAYGG